MATTNPYLVFEGNCKEAFDFYRTIFNGEFAHILYFKDHPEEEHKAMTPEEGEKIKCICLPISAETMLIGSDAIAVPYLGTNISGNANITIHTIIKGEAQQLFEKLSAEGAIKRPLNSYFNGLYHFGVVTDQFGIDWIIIFDENKVLSHKKPFLF